MTAIRPAPVIVLSERLGAVTSLERSLEALGAVVRGAALWTVDDIVANAADARIIILGAVEPFGADVIDGLPALEAVVRRGVGHDNIDIDAATRQGIIVANVPDASVEEVSDHALALLLALERGIGQLDRAVHDGWWTHDPSRIDGIRSPVRRFSTLTLGVIGLGRIGRALVRKAAGVYGRVMGSDPMVSAAGVADLQVDVVDLDDLLANADHLSIHAPLTPSTRHLLSQRSLELLRPGAVVVNTSRGGLVDEAMLISAVRTGRIRAAGLDVTEHEPVVPEDPLLATDGIVLTAHSAALSTMAKAELAERSVAAAADLLRGGRPASIVNPEVLGSPKLRHRTTDGR